MSVQSNDPLLGFARLLVVITQILAVIASVAVGIGIGVLATIGRGEVFARIAKSGAPDSAFPLLLTAFALIFILLQLAYRFFRELGAIIATVGAGEPFDPANAGRLEKMGWLSAGAQVLGFILAGIASWFAPYLARLEVHGDAGFGVEITGILLTLVLFILARVFREGARMRNDLEGTV